VRAAVDLEECCLIAPCMDAEFSVRSRWLAVGPTPHLRAGGCDIIGHVSSGLSILMHVGAHGVWRTARGLNMALSQWLCSLPRVRRDQGLSPLSSAASMHDAQHDDPDLILSRRFQSPGLSYRRKFWRDSAARPVYNAQRKPQFLNALGGRNRGPSRSGRALLGPGWNADRLQIWRSWQDLPQRACGWPIRCCELLPLVTLDDGPLPAIATSPNMAVVRIARSRCATRATTRAGFSSDCHCALLRSTIISRIICCSMSPATTCPCS